MKYNKSIAGFYLLCGYFCLAFAEDDSIKIEKDVPDNLAIKPEAQEFNPYLKLNKNGIQVYIFNHKDSEFATFKAITHLRASMDSVLAVMLDNQSGTEWIDACKDSFLIKKISFNERYHYQIFATPFPFIERDFIFHSTMKHKPENNTITIKMSSEPDYCNNNQSQPCKKVNQSKL